MYQSEADDKEPYHSTQITTSALLGAAIYWWIGKLTKPTTEYTMKIQKPKTNPKYTTKKT